MCAIGPSWAQVQHDPYCELAAGAAPTGWEGAKGEAMAAPVVAVSPDAAVGSTSVRGTARAEGEWQGIILKLPKPIDLTKYRSLSFHIKHNCRPGHKACSTVMRVGFEQGLGMYRVFDAGGGEWHRVELPLDPNSWEPIGKQVKLELGTAVRLIWYPFRMMREPGKFMAIDGLRFHPKVADSHAIPVQGYTHAAPPTRGDPKCTVLADGGVMRKAQAYWRQFADLPDVRFDLGGIYLVDKLRVQAEAVPAQNFSEIILSASVDGEEWQPIASIKNTDTRGEVAPHQVEKPDLNALGRYFRIQVRRHRQDFPIVLGEVTFFGKLPTPQEMASAAKAHYHIGPSMPETTEKDYWRLRTESLSAWVHKKTGIVVGVTQNGKRIVERLYNSYEMATKKESQEADSYGDAVQSHRVEGDTIVLTMTNPELRNVTITQRIRLEDGRVEQKTRVAYAGGPKAFFLVSRQVVLPPAWREHGVYETWGSGHEMVRRFASDVVFDVAADSSPVLTFENPREKHTLFHYRYAFGDRFSRLGGGKVTVAGYGAKRTIFAANGWQLGDGQFLLGDDRPNSVETHLACGPGSIIDAYERYLELPGPRKLRGAIRRPEWLERLRCVAGTGWIGLCKGVSDRLVRRYHRLLREGGILIMMSDTNSVWGEFPTHGTVRNRFGGEQDAEDLRAKIERIKAVSPRFRVSLYTWLWSAFEFSKPCIEHPEWFLTKDRHGGTASFFPGVATNFVRFAGIKESQDEMFHAIHNYVNAYDQDCWYLDGGGSRSVVDWWNMRLDDLHGWDDLSVRLRAALQKDDPDRIVFFNNPENPLADLGFLESHSGVLTRNWRQGAGWMWKFELWQRADPLFNPLYIYWTGQAEGAFENYLVGLGLLPTYCSRFIDPKDIPYVSAQQQTRFVRLVDSDLSPNWRHDPETLLEALPVTLGRAGWVFMRSHAKTPTTYTVATDTAPLGMTDRNAPIYQWVLRIRDARQWDGRLGEGEVASVYRETGWSLDRAVLPELAGPTIWTARAERAVPIAPEEGVLWMMTQSPGLVMSVDHLPVQLWLPETLGVKVTGRTDHVAVQLSVESTRDHAEILALIPEGQAPAGLTIDGRDVSYDAFLCNGARAVAFPVGKGRHTAVCTLRAANPPATPPRLTLRPAEAGRTLTASIQVDDAWQGRQLVLCAVKDGALTWKKLAPAASDVQIPIPKAMEGGTVQFTVADLSGLRRAAQAVKLEAGRPQTPLPRVHVHHEAEQEVRGVEGVRDPISVTHEGWSYSKKNGRVETEPAKRRVAVESHKMYASHYNCTAAGLAMKLKRFARLRFSGTFHRYNSNVMQPGRHFVKYDAPSCFAGLLLDFGTAKGYTARTAVGLGKVYPTRRGNLPAHYGTGRKPDHIVTLSDFILKKTSTETIWLDFEQLGTPADWDGRVWLTAAIQNVCPSRRLAVEVLETADHLPPGHEVREPIDLLNAGQSKRTFDVPRVKDAVSIDGRLAEPFWKQATVLDEFTLLGNPSSKAPQRTRVHLLHDGHTLYIGFTCDETEKRVINTDHGAGGAPWRNDSIEIYLRIVNTKHDLMHLIVDPDGHHYQAIEDHVTLNGKRERVRWPKRFGASQSKGQWTVEAAVPLSRLGLTGSAAGKLIGCNFGRNRHAAATEHYTLVPGNRFAAVNRYSLKLQ